MRKIKNAISIMLIISMLSGCGMTGVFESKSDGFYERHDPKKLAAKEADTVFEYLKNEDIDSLIELFSDDVKSSHDLEAEWQAFFDHIDGNIESYDGLSFPGEGMNIDKDGEIYDSHLTVRFNNVVTSNNKTYVAISYYQRRIYKEEPSSEGINIFSIKKKSDIGTIIDDFVVGDIPDHAGG